MTMIDWFMPMLRDLVTELAPVAFLIWGVSFAWDMIIGVASGNRRRLK